MPTAYPTFELYTARMGWKVLPEPKNTLLDFMDFVSGEGLADDGYGTGRYSPYIDLCRKVVEFKNQCLAERDDEDDKDAYEIHMNIDDFVMKLPIDDVQVLLNRRGIIQIMRYIRDVYGNEFMADMLDKDDDMFKRALCYNLIDEYMREIIQLKDEYDDEEEAFLNEEDSDEVYH